MSENSIIVVHPPLFIPLSFNNASIGDYGSE